MDARTQRRINRAKRRDEILKKEQEKRKKKWIRATAKTQFIQSATQFQPLDSTTWPKELTFDERYIRRNSERLVALAFTDNEKKLLAETRKRELFARFSSNSLQFTKLKWPLLLRKIEHNVSFTQELVRANNMLIGREAGHKRVIDFKNRELVRLKRQLDEANRALNESKK